MFDTSDGGRTWLQKQKLVATGGRPYDAFGGAVVIHGNTMVVGAFGDDNERGGNAGIHVGVPSSFTFVLTLSLSFARVCVCVFQR